MGNLRFLTVFIFSILFSLVGFTQEQKELLLNGGFESGVAKWKSYCDAAGITPVDGVGGGVAGFAISASTTSPLAGKSSGIITKDAANRQGCGVATDFTVQEENKAQVLQVKIPYKITSGTYADDQYKVYVYDIDNASMIEVAPTFIKNSSIKETYRGTFQTSLTGVNYRLIIHNASTSAVASTMKIEGSISSQTIATGSFQTDWKNYPGSPSFANVNLGTGGTSYFQYKEFGDSIIVRAGFVLGAGGSLTGTLQIPIPSGMSIDYTGIQAISACGTAYSVDTGANRPSGTIVTGNGANHLRVTGAQLGASGLEWGTSVPFAWANTYSFNFTSDPIKIQGKTSNTVLSSEYSQTDIFARATNASGSLSTSPSDITWTTVERDTVGGFSATSNVVNYTIKTNGYYDIDGQIYSGGTTAANGYFQTSLYNTTTSSQIAETSTTYEGVKAVNGGERFSYHNIYLPAGTQIKIRANTDKTSPTIVAVASQNYLSIKKSNGGGATQVATSESISARYKTAAGQSIANASTPVIDFGTKEFDDVGSVTTGGSWKFTPNAAGKFEVCVRVRYANGQTWTATTSYAAAYLYKNGSSYSALGEVFFPATSTPSNSGPHLPGCDVIKLLSTDFIDVRTAHNEGSARTLLGSDAHNWITIKRVGNY